MDGSMEACDYSSQSDDRFEGSAVDEMIMRISVARYSSVNGVF